MRRTAHRPPAVLRGRRAAAAEGAGTFVKQLGGRAHFGHVRIRVEPNPSRADVVVDFAAFPGQTLIGSPSLLEQTQTVS